MSELRGQVAVVTGASAGIGAAIAARLADAGAHVANFDVAEGVDVTNEHAVRAAVDALVTEHRRIDVLVNNAGIYPHTPFEELTLGEWRRVLATNLDGAFTCAHAVYPAMRGRGYGRIVNISSAGFLVGEIGLTHYIASKGGLIGLTRALAHGAGIHGVTVNAITPGFIRTPGVDASREERSLMARIVREQAVPRPGMPEDIAGCVAFLASPAAGFITGQTLNVDGGHRFH